MSSTNYRPRFGYDIRINPDPPPRRPTGTARPCAVSGCREPAESNVPKRRENLEDRQWLCRDHLREHNAGWNYFAGMMPDEIERYCREALTGHRPTWRLGERAAKPHDQPGHSEGGWSYRFEDGYAIFEEAAEPAARAAPKRRLTKSQLDALTALNLEETATLHEIKARYKELVKRFHPDANGGNRGTEERLRQVIKAYGHLRATGFA